MKYHVQFLDRQTNGKIYEACGSDGVYILDGRNNLNTMILDAKARAYMLRNIHKFVGFKIKHGDRFSSATTIYQDTLDYNNLIVGGDTV